MNTKIEQHGITIKGNLRKVFFLNFYIDFDITQNTHYAAVTKQHGKILMESFPFQDSKLSFDLFLNLILLI